MEEESSYVSTNLSEFTQNLPEKRGKNVKSRGYCVKYFHSNKNDQFGRFICGYCDGTFENESKLFSHMDSEHPETRNSNLTRKQLEIKCWSCGNKMDGKRALAEHVKHEHQNGQIDCVQCDEKFVSYVKLVEHCYASHPIPKFVRCELCEDFVTDSEKELLEHVKYHVSATSKNEDPALEESRSICETSTSQSEKNGPTSRASLSSEDNNSGYRNMQGTAVKQNSHEFEHTAEHNSNSAMNEEPAIVLLNVEDLEELSDNTCSVCQKIFGCKRSLKRHLRQQHKIEKPHHYTCKLCNGAFPSHKELKVHCSTEHDVVGKEFTNIYKENSTAKSQLPTEPLWTTSQSPILDETGDKFACHLCNFSFTRKFSLRRHLKQNHGIENPGLDFTCDLCEGAFPSFKELKIHSEKVHDVAKQSLWNYKSTPTITENYASQAESVAEIAESSNSNTSQLSSESDSLPSREIGNKIATSSISHTSTLKVRQNQKKINLPTNPTIYSCGQCTESFSSVKKLRIHVETDLHLPPGKKKISCQQCPEIFQTISDLNAHQNTAHKIKQINVNTEKLLSCSTCNVTFKKFSSLKRHIVNNCCNKTRSSYNCCDQIFAGYRELKIHQSQVDLPCKDCADILKSHSELVAHRASVHDAKPFMCKYCGMPFLEKHDLREHKKPVTEESLLGCEHCADTFVSGCFLTVHLRSDHHQCDRCSTIHDNVEELLEHSFSEHPKDDMSLRCYFCDKEVTGHLRLSLHAQEHMKNDRFYCNTCESKSYKEAKMLFYHLRSGHTSLRGMTAPAKCNICGKVCVNTYRLKLHQKCHQEGKTFMCDQCGATYKTIVGLHMHEKRHLGIRPYKCDRCEMSFYQKDNLKIHIRKHTGEKPYQCTICGKCYQHPMGLKIHTRTHTGERPYKCTLCPKAFINNDAFKRHKLWHSGDKPHACHMCSARYVKAITLKAHVEKCHGSEEALRLDGKKPKRRRIETSREKEHVVDDSPLFTVSYEGN